MMRISRKAWTSGGGPWDPPSIFGAGGYLGSLTGALASSVSTCITQRHQDRQELLAKRIFWREQLYPDFISESAHALADAVQHNLAQRLVIVVEEFCQLLRGYFLNRHQIFLSVANINSTRNPINSA